MTAPHNVEFGSRPFVAGSLTGIRTYRVEQDGALTGVHFRQVVQRGENYAVCGMPPRRPGGEAEETTEEHRVAGLGCACGFYGYFDGSDDYLRSGLDGGARVEAIVEAYGTVVVGSRGFRAEKLRVVALIRTNPPAERRLWRDQAALYLGARPVLSVLIVGGCMGGGLATAALTATVSAWWVLPEAALFAAAVYAHRLYRRGWRRLLERRLSRLMGRHTAPTPEAWDAVKRRYPGVPVYTSRKAALAAHPLTVPEAS